MDVQLIAARSLNNVIGNGPEIPWRAKGEQKIFRDITMGGTLIMGRKTFESIGKPLPGRETIIITRSDDLSFPGCHIAGDLKSAIEQAEALGKPIFVAGGGEIYAQSMALATQLHITTIEIECEGDVFLPEFDIAQYQLVSEQAFETNLKYTYQHFVKK